MNEKIIAKIKSKLDVKKMAQARDRIVDDSRAQFKIALVAAIGILVVTGVIYVIFNLSPYAIIVDGEPACYVRGKEAARETILYIVEEYTPKNTTYKTFDTDGRLSFKKANPNASAGDEIISSEEAAQYILDTYQEGKNPIKIKIASAKTKIKPYTPKPKYVKDKKMLAGQSRVKKKGTKGKQKVSTTFVSVNGIIKSKGVSNKQVIDKGKPATVAKGTLGLPKGKDWRTYKGLPVYKNGKELVTTAKQYKGAPYKYGGYSLTHGIDCVQFVRQMYAKYGIKLPNNHSGLQHSGVAVPYSKAKKGDIVCYGNHVGIYIGKGRMINAVHRGVSISRVKKGRIKTIRRVVK